MKITRLPRQIFLTLILCAAVGWVQPARGDSTVTVFAAASLKTALDEVAKMFEQASGATVSLSYGGSSELARHIQYGAPAQIFLSANAGWMDWLQDYGLLVSGTRVDILSNRLVLIAGPESEISLKIKPDVDLLGALNEGWLAMALVDAVPAGIYGREALMTLGIWDSVQARTAQTNNVRAALRLVSLGEAPLGIVYATDAIADPMVRIVDVFPDTSHAPIIYPAARLTQGDGPVARAFLEFLTGPQARAVFDQHGFGAPEKDGP